MKDVSWGLTLAPTWTTRDTSPFIIDMNRWEKHQFSSLLGEARYTAIQADQIRVEIFSALRIIMGFSTYAVALLMMVGFSGISAQVCDDGWSYYEVKCYQYVNQAVTITEAFSNCNEKGAWLVKIDNQGENDFISSMATTGGIAIGLRRDSAGDFKWIDGTIPSYTNWAQGEPNNSGGNEDCTMMYMGSGDRQYKWNDCICTATMQFVCEKDANICAS